MKKKITYDNYLRLCGLLTLAADHRKALEDIERSAMRLLGIANTGGHTSDAVWSEPYTAERLLDLLNIAMPEDNHEQA